MWNIVLIDVAFALALYGMFMTAAGRCRPCTPSEHRRWLGVPAVPRGGRGGSAGDILLAIRSDAQRPAAGLPAVAGSSIPADNLLLLGVAFATLWGTVYPLLSRLFADQEITVARPFYDQVNGPLMLALVLLMGVGPLLPWRRANLQSLRRALMLPGSVAAAWWLFCW